MQDESRVTKNKTRPVKVTLANGTTAIVQVQSVAGEAPVSIKSVPFEKVAKAVEGVTQSLTEVWEKTKPSKATVEFGVDFAWDTGELLAMFVDGSASASMKITLEWEKSSSQPS
jgi:uncharacterized protein YoxC